MATEHQVAHYQGLAQQAQNWRAVAADFRAEQIEAGRQQAARIAGLTWLDVACAIRALGMPEASEDFTRVCRALACAIRARGMPEASEDFTRVCRALSHVVGEVGFDTAEELIQSLDIAAECAEELRMPLLVSEREQADADARDRAERAYEERRDAL